MTLKNQELSLRSLYDYLRTAYGDRRLWLAEVAAELDISKREASILTQELGFHRGKALAVVPFEDWRKSEAVGRIFSSMTRGLITQ